MTVKLAKFFSSSAAAPPPLPPPNPSNPHNYYYARNHHQQQQQHQQPPQQQQQPQQRHHHHQQQQHYNAYMDEDDVSLYSTAASILTERDHPFNNSQRPLLAERKPQLLHKKKLNVVAAQQPQQTQHQPQPQQQQKSYISPYVQQQKRDSAKGLHGFNDFDILSQQYNSHLQSPYIGYPYGSPPSPTANSNDFVFDTLMTHGNHNEQAFPNTTLPPHYSNDSNNTYATTNTPSYRNNLNEADYHANSAIATKQIGQDYMGKSSRFEDDFCSRRNVEFSKTKNIDANPTISGSSGPFIFGIPYEQQSDLGRISTGGRRFSDSTHTVINIDNGMDKYSAQSGQATMQSTSDTSSSSQDSSSNKGAKFLLRKSKSKQNKKDKQTKAEPPKKPTIKCVVVGDGAVGKTNLILSYLENRFNPEHVPTASDIYNADVMVNDSPVHLTLCDTAGQDTLDPLRELCYPDSDVFLLCFSVAKPETFHAIKMKWAPKFTKTKAALILVGTQADLRSNANMLNKLQTNGEKPISYADAWDLATTIGAKYIETSSATQDKVKEVFDTAIWEGLIPTTLPPTPPLWKKLLCLA